MKSRSLPLRTMLWRTMLCAVLLISMPLVSHAQETSDQALSQGQFAVVFANQLGLNAGLSHPLTPAEAVNMLTEVGILPFGGWSLDTLLTPNDLARMIVQSLGALDEIDDAEEDNPQTTAYMDYLKRVYNLEIVGTDPAQARVVGKSGEPSAAGQFGDRVSSDPLKGRGPEGDVDELTAGGKSSGVPSFVTQRNLNQILEEIIPAPGGGGTGQVDEETVDTTPSAPTPF